jgi:NAD(P)-dependent dehydrogenase (short-subunit alcohol dehydrogenase family)
VAVVDVLDDAAVDKYLEGVVEQAGGIDVEFNATGPRAAEYGTGIPAVDLPVDRFLTGQTVLTGQFITARCAARRMVAQGSGVIIFLTGSPARPHFPGGAAIGAANEGIDRRSGGRTGSGPAARPRGTPGPARRGRKGRNPAYAR